MTSKKVHKVLIANRGEIAVRVLRTTHRLGLPSVAVYSDDDSEALHCRMADETYCLGSGTLKETYLNIQKIIDAALDTGADAIYPGYGFLSENADFAEACEANNILFIGPRSETMRLMGDKAAAREFALQHNIPVLSGVSGSIADIEAQADNLSYPLLIKAALGGGGKGMHIVDEKSHLHDALEMASREADRYFGNSQVLVEKYIPNPHHIEVQILADTFGNIVHLHERECSIQRRYQKIIEESPSPSISDTTREKMCRCAIDIAREAGYVNAGTIEFLVDDEQNFYFLEMNTRIQVEHPVTEQRLGLDLVEEQIRIARGKEMSWTQDLITPKGHAIECRIYAEDATRDFTPTPGEVRLYNEPQGRGIRIDSSIDGPYTINANYDPMLAKLICHGKTRSEAIEITRNALKNFIIQTEATNIPYLREIIENDHFINAEINTHFCQEQHENLLAAMQQRRTSVPYENVAALFLFYDFNNRYFLQKPTESVWEQVGYWRFEMKINVVVEGENMPVTIQKLSHNRLICSINGKPYDIRLTQKLSSTMRVVINGKIEQLFVSETPNFEYYVHLQGLDFVCHREDILSQRDYSSHTKDVANTDAYISPMPGKVVKINVTTGDKVAAGTTLCVVEAMKMENEIKANKDFVVSEVFVKEGDKVETKQILVK